MVDSPRRPLVTFALFAYNHESFIREAMEGAFSQTYSPLQIILSDDCSSDRTFKIMEEMAAGYRGPHRIILNRNSKNLGVGSHLNRLMGMAEGELVVIAAGDDISLPERTDLIYATWEKSGGAAMSIYSDVMVVDSTGREKGIFSNPLPSYIDNLEEMALNLCPGVIGASHAWSSELFRRFGDLSSSVTLEDRAISFRALLVGRIAHIDKPLVKYRRHFDNITAWGDRGQPKLRRIAYQIDREISYNISVMESYMTDLKTWDGQTVELEELLLKRIDSLRFQSALMHATLRAKLSVMRKGMKTKLPLIPYVTTVVKCLAPSLYYSFLYLKRLCGINDWDRKMVGR